MPVARWGTIVLFVLLVGCATPPENLVLIGIDTLRADHLGCYGYARPTSPHIDALAAESVLYTTAVSSSPWTLPAFASLFTGVLPSTHRAGEGKRGTPGAPNSGFSALGPSPDTLAGVLRRAGFRTASFASTVWLGPRFGMDRGFDVMRAAARSEPTVDRAVAWLHHAVGRGRFFLFVHLLDPHGPYTPSAADAAPFLDPAYGGSLGTSVSDSSPDPEWSDADRRRVIDLYDGEVHYTDRLVGRILDTLRELHLLERTLVVLTADHGEELFERGALGHGQSLYDEQLHVPLVVRFPAANPRGRITAQVRTIDVMPTVLGALGVPVPAGVEGASLLALSAGGRRRADGVALAEYTLYVPERQALRQLDRKLVYVPESGRAMLFDLAADPDEREDVQAERPEMAAPMVEALERRLVGRIGTFRLQAAAGRSAHRLRVTLRCDSRFLGVGLTQRERGDGYELSADGRELVLGVQLDTDDVDVLEFRTGDETAVEMRVLLDDRPCPAERVRVGARSVRPDAEWRFSQEDARVEAPGGEQALTAGPALALTFVDPSAPAPAYLDDETGDRLRALGYLN